MKKSSGKQRRGSAMHLKSAGSSKSSGTNKGVKLPSIAKGYAPSEGYKGGKGHNEKHC